MIVATWNLSITCGGLLGGEIVRLRDADDLPWSVVFLLAMTGWVILRHHREGFA